MRMDWTDRHQDTFTLQGDLYDEAAGERVEATSYTQPLYQIIDGNASAFRREYYGTLDAHPC